MRKISLALVIFILGTIAIVRIAEDNHKKRFEKFMLENNVDYSDAGCEYGWEMTTMFKPWSGPNGKTRLQKLWNECDSINLNTKGDEIPFEVYKGMTQDEYNKIAPYNED
jgi:hypothetical protein